MMQEFDSHCILSNKIAKYYGKNNGVILYSGTLALESALLFSHIKEGDYVLIPNNVCYRILLPILRLKATPVLIQPSDGLCITADEIAFVQQKLKIKAAIIVHNIGIPVDIESIKNICNNKTVLIEDASLGWDLVSKGNDIGKFSDYVISSFGINKPLSFGIGGGVFANNDSIYRLVDHKDIFSRTQSILPIPYTLPIEIIKDIDYVVKLANENVRIKRLFAEFVSEILNGTNIQYWKSALSDRPTWHRFPIWHNNNKMFRKLIHSLERFKIKYQPSHSLLLAELPILKNIEYLFYNFEKLKINRAFLYSNQIFNKDIFNKWSKDL